MADKTPLVAALQTEPSTTLKSGLPVYTYIYRRSYTCGHAPELIKVSKLANQQGVVQTILRPEQVEKEGEVLRWLKFRLGRCWACAIRLREHHESMQENGKGGGMRPVAAYQGEGIRLDWAFLREARSGFEAALKQLDRVSCCGGEGQEEEWPLTREVVGGDDDSIRVVNFLDGRLKVDSPASSPSPFSHDSNDPWSLRGGDDDASGGYGIADCSPCAEGIHRQRKDSASEVRQNAEPSCSKGVHTLRLAEGRKEYLQGVYLEAPRTPIAFTLGPRSDLDCISFLYLLRNNKLSFDDIAELVSRYSLDNSDPILNDIAQQSLSVDHQSNIRDSTLESSTGQPGVVEWDCSSDQVDSQASTLRSDNSRCTIGDPSCGEEDQNLNDREPCYHEPAQAQNAEGQGKTGKVEGQAVSMENAGDLDQSHHDGYSDEPSAAQSCFSSDSSVDSIEFSKPGVDVTANRTKPTALSWWKPRKKYHGIHEATRAASIPDFQEYPVGLWKRISKKTSDRMLNKNTEGETDRKLQAKLSKMEESSMRASRMREGSAHRGSHCPQTHKKQTTPPIVQSDVSTSPHMLSAMRTLKSPRASQSMTSNTTKSQRGNHNSPACISKSRCSISTHFTRGVTPHGIHPVHRPYRPSPLKHFTRVTLLDVNKGLPPLPPEARRLAHQASKGIASEKR